MPDVVTIQHVCMHGTMEQLALERLGNGRFPRPREAGQPNDCSAMADAHYAFASGNFSFGPKNVFALRSFSVGIDAAENRAATADPPIVHDNKSAQIRDAIMVVDDEWAASLNCQSANLIALQLFASVALRLERRGIRRLLDRHDLAFDVLRRQAQVVKMAKAQRLAHNPEKIRMKTVRLDRCFVFVGRNITAFDENLFAQRDPD